MTRKKQKMEDAQPRTTLPLTRSCNKYGTKPNNVRKTFHRQKDPQRKTNLILTSEAVEPEQSPVVGLVLAGGSGSGSSLALALLGGGRCRGCCCGGSSSGRGSVSGAGDVGERSVH